MGTVAPRKFNMFSRIFYELSENVFLPRQVKSGDYTIYVHIIEVRDLKAEDLQVNKQLAWVYVYYLHSTVPGGCVSLLRTYFACFGHPHRVLSRIKILATMETRLP